jgi:hypothetical protein
MAKEYEALPTPRGSLDSESIADTTRLTHGARDPTENTRASRTILYFSTLMNFLLLIIIVVESIVLAKTTAPAETPISSSKSLRTRNMAEHS